jgi:hypothetical protein
VPKPDLPWDGEVYNLVVNPTARKAVAQKAAEYVQNAHRKTQVQKR